MSASVLQTILPAYLYDQYTDDPDLPGFFQALNGLMQSYLDWYNQTPLSVYTASSISGPLLDWIGNGLYGIARPVISSLSTTSAGGYDSVPYNTLAYNQYFVTRSSTATIATDDIYKRVLTWAQYAGDGRQASIPWLRRRIARFLYGANGSDIDVGLITNVGITVSGSVLTIEANPSSILAVFQILINSGILPLPFQCSYVIANYLFNNGGALQVASAAGYPTSSSGLSAGALWSNGGVVSVAGTTTPSPTAPAVYFNTISAASLLALGGANLPLSNPGIGTSILWNNGGVVSIA